MFLTAFVVRTLKTAKPYIYVDDNVLNKAISWIIRHQLENGCFPAVSHVFQDMVSVIYFLLTLFIFMVHYVSTDACSSFWIRHCQFSTLNWLRLRKQVVWRSEAESCYLSNVVDMNVQWRILIYYFSMFIGPLNITCNKKLDQKTVLIYLVLRSRLSRMSCRLSGMMIFWVMSVASRYRFLECVNIIYLRCSDPWSIWSLLAFGPYCGSSWV